MLFVVLKDLLCSPLDGGECQRHSGYLLGLTFISFAVGCGLPARLHAYSKYKVKKGGSVDIHTGEVL